MVFATKLVKTIVLVLLAETVVVLVFVLVFVLLFVLVLNAVPLLFTPTAGVKLVKSPLPVFNATKHHRYFYRLACHWLAQT